MSSPQQEHHEEKRPLVTEENVKPEPSETKLSELLAQMDPASLLAMEFDLSLFGYPR